jgi:hypothetical protein
MMMMSSRCVIRSRNVLNEMYWYVVCYFMVSGHRTTEAFENLNVAG